MHNTARKEDADRKVVDQAHNAAQIEDAGRKGVGQAHNTARKEGVDRRISEDPRVVGRRGSESPKEVVVLSPVDPGEVALEDVSLG